MECEFALGRRRQLRTRHALQLSRVVCHVIQDLLREQGQETKPYRRDSQLEGMSLRVCVSARTRHKRGARVVTSQLRSSDPSINAIILAGISTGGISDTSALISPSMERVACVVAGETRTIAATASSLRQNVVGPLDADVFLHVSDIFSVSWWVHPATAEKPPHNITTAQQVRVVLATLSPVSYTVRQNLKLFERWRLAYQTVEAYEAAHGWEYAWIVRVRPDLIYACAMSRSFLNSLRHRPFMQHDVIAVLPRSLARTAMERAGETFECKVRPELCVHSALVRLANASLWISSNTSQIPKIYRYALCPPSVVGNRIGTSRNFCHTAEQERMLRATRPEPLCAPNHGSSHLLTMDFDLRFRVWSRATPHCVCNGTDMCASERRYCA